MLDIGAQLGPYIIIRQLGAGGMGVVFLARHRHIGREAAIKVLLPELTRNEDIVARFLTEARATAAIRHPGIVEILDCDIDPSGRAFIVMEYLRGESLAQRLARGTTALRDLAAVVTVGSQVASALAAAHARGIVHRDLKPDNIFLATDGGASGAVTIKILDFGIAKLISGDGEQGLNKTRTGSLLGTPAYMSPEQCRDASAIDHRADVYALGCILFEMVAGRPPFVRQGSGEIIVAHVVEPPPSLSSLAPDVDPALEALIAQMLQKDPAARPQTMSEIAGRLEALASGRPAIITAVMPTTEDAPPSGPIAVSTSISTAARAPSGAGVPAAVTASASRPVLAGGTRVMAAGRHFTTMSDSAAEVGEEIAGPAKRRSGRLVAAVAGLGALALGGLLIFKSHAAPPAAPAPEPVRAAPAPPPPPTPPPAPKDVTLEVVSEPADAEVWLATDKAARGRTPFRVTVDRQAAPTQLILKAHGYADGTVDLDPQAPSPIKVTLVKAALAKAAPEGKARKHSSSGYKLMGD
jgi:tRNA A-37 threonylcarbamoyl transferase component Bud32